MPSVVFSPEVERPVFFATNDPYRPSSSHSDDDRRSISDESIRRMTLPIAHHPAIASEPRVQTQLRPPTIAFSLDPARLKSQSTQSRPNSRSNSFASMTSTKEFACSAANFADTIIAENASSRDAISVV